MSRPSSKDKGGSRRTARGQTEGQKADERMEKFGKKKEAIDAYQSVLHASSVIYLLPF